MKSIIIKISIFLVFMIASIAIIACSDNFAVSVSEPENIATTDQIGAVSNLTVRLGYTDSLTLNYVAENNKSLMLTEEYWQDSLESHVERFHLSWNEAIGAQNYDIRVYTKPINESNWYLAQKMDVANITNNGGKVTADAVLFTTPQILTGKCIGCGECQRNCPVDAINMLNGKAVINYDKCVECGECFRSCEYDAVGGTFAGTEYYFAIRAFNGKRGNLEYSNKIYSTNSAYELRYSTVASIPDTAQAKRNAKITVTDLGGLIYYDTLSTKGCGFGESGNCQFYACFITVPTSEFCDPLDSRKNAVANSSVRAVDSTKYKDAPNSVCPVDAIYSVGLDSVLAESLNTTVGAVFIDINKCVNCGRCVAQCYGNGHVGAVTTEVIKVGR